MLKHVPTDKMYRYCSKNTLYEIDTKTVKSLTSLLRWKKSYGFLQPERNFLNHLVIVP